MSKEKENILTVQELIELLKECPLDLPVWLEGHDVYGSCYGMQIQNLDTPVEYLLLRGAYFQNLF